MSIYDFTLSDEEIFQYREQGFLVPSFRFSTQQISMMRDAYDKLLAQNPTIASDLMLGPHATKPGAQGLKGSSIWFDFATHPDLLDIAQQLIGQDLILWATTIWGKPAHSGKETPWHQDGDYYPIRPMETVTIWIPLDDATVKNGCMQFIPGSHKAKEILSHHWDNSDQISVHQILSSEQFDEKSAINHELEAGQVSFHDVHLIHRSGPNRSNKRRAALAVRLMPGYCYFDHDLGKEKERPHRHHDYGARPLYLLRGEDRTGRNNFEVGR